MFSIQVHIRYSSQDIQDRILINWKIDKTILNSSGFLLAKSFWSDEWTNEKLQNIWIEKYKK